MLAAAGLSLADLQAWGGTIRHDDGLPHNATRAEALRSSATDAIFDEGTYSWVDLAVDWGMRFLSLDGDALARLEAMGYRAGTLTRERYPALDTDVSTLDFSGWLIFTRRDTPEGVVTSLREALAQAAGRIAWQGGPTLPLERMCTDTIDAPVPLPPPAPPGCATGFCPTSRRRARDRRLVDPGSGPVVQLRARAGQDGVGSSSG